MVQYSITHENYNKVTKTFTVISAISGFCREILLHNEKTDKYMPFIHTGTDFVKGIYVYSNTTSRDFLEGEYTLIVKMV